MKTEVDAFLSADDDGDDMVDLDEYERNFWGIGKKKKKVRRLHY